MAKIEELILLRLIRPILLVGDNDNDIELTLIALKKAKVANPVDVGERWC